jgi:hypothetical protein
MNGAAARVSRGTVSSDPQMQEPVRPFRRHRLVRMLETRRYREVERELSDDGRFRAASVTDDIERVFEILDIDLHGVTSAVEHHGDSERARSARQSRVRRRVDRT